MIVIRRYEVISVMDKFTPYLKSSLSADNFKILPLAGDASSRSYFRVVSGENSYILMSWEPFDPSTYPFLTVASLFKNHGVNVPQIISQSGEQGLMLLEDLGDLTLERKFWEFQDESLVLPYYKKSIDELIKIQFLTTKDSDKSCIAFNTKFDHDKFLWEFNYTYKHLLKGILKTDLSHNDEKLLFSDFSKISEKLASHSNYISHRDYHSRNLMIKLGEIKVIDFQDARLGPLQYDLVSLLHDSYVDLSSESQLSLINYYKNNIKSFVGNDFSNDEFDEIYKIQTVQRCLKACGSFASFYMTREDRRYLKYLNKTLTVIFNELIELDGLKLLLKLLNDSGALTYGYNKL